MNRITDYSELQNNIVTWIKEYANSNGIESLVVGISGGIDSSVVSTLCAETGLPTYALSMPLMQISSQSELSNTHREFLSKKYNNVISLKIDLSTTYNQFLTASRFWLGEDMVSNNLALANTKSRLRMVTLYQVAGSVKGIVVGTGNKVEDYGVGFYTKYGDGGVDIAPIADLYKTEVWELGKHLGVDQRIIDAQPTDGLWEDGRTDENQIGASYAELEEAMENGTGPAVEILKKFNAQNKHKMISIPTFKL
jgi:NAD+ synthase